jgi:hypothetical protein
LLLGFDIETKLPVSRQCVRHWALQEGGRMQESDRILQLGIAAAREGDHQEARELFRLITRQEPENSQAWLWLAGVAESADERRAALERVVAIDPSNEMARKSLQVMGSTPSASSTSSTPTTPAPEPQPATSPDAGPPIDAPPPQPVDLDAPLPRSSTPATPMTEDEEYAAALDSAYEGYDDVPRAEAPPRREPGEGYGDTVAVGGTARERIETRRNSRRTSRMDDDDVPVRRGPSPLLYGLLALVLIAALALFLFNMLGNRGGDSIADSSQNGTAVGGGVVTNGAATNDPGGVATTAEATPSLPGDATTPPVTGVLTATQDPGVTSPVTETTPVTDTGAPVEPTPAPPTEATAAPPPPPPAGDPAAANPAPVEVGAVLEANGWSYTFPGICGLSCAAVVGPQIGGNTAQGTYAVVLVSVANNTGTDQPLPADFFVLKDEQGRVYNALPAVSSAYAIPGVNADLSQETAVSANGVLTSMPLVFDVNPGATNLVLFSPYKQDQGWPALSAVP